MTSIDWKTEIAGIGHWKQLAAQHDRSKALPWRLPRVGAQEAEIAEAEHALGTRLPAEFKEFLSLANGWLGFHVLTDLFGTIEFVGGRSSEVMARTDVASFLVGSGWGVGDVMAIGASALDRDVFLLVLGHSNQMPGGVIWLAGEEVDRYPSFHAFVAAMANYNARVAQALAHA